ncbi:type IV pilus assembly protein PilX [Variovorax sp. TBS-050B]|jgi:type IV pilus assembly protein PilX|uniref:pilus assembly protein PilX n=1 Tax=Variovorax sp. TBS-050B TaxID=2940551 RepID=UPI002476A372|nr:pilus assembly protein PilX [Variovorax sp. TBS-050B]MDH6591955.1 type IV pilus assembly protein PilX [Variovorax sp. TBS-050B]
MKPQISFRAQRGVSLLFALLALVALSLATLALVRSVDTGALVLGNIGFKQDATVAGDQATREAIAWLKANAASLNNDAPAAGYYASTKELKADKTKDAPVDVTGQQQQAVANRKLVDWSDEQDKKCPYAAAGSFGSCELKSVNAAAVTGGNKARYVIFRLCAAEGSANDDINNSCAQPLASNTSASGRGLIDYATPRFSTTGGPYYRIVVRVLGARNTVGFTETIVNFY